MLSALFIIAAIIIFCFGIAVFIGAPWLPTLPAQADTAFELLALDKGDTLIDLGCGDGGMLIRAARRGIKAVGYEVNPILFVVARVRTLRFGKRVRVYYANFWTVDWPEAEGIFVFLHTRFMRKLDRHLQVYAKDRRVRVCSFTYEIPDKKPIKQDAGVYMYEYGPLANQ